MGADSKLNIYVETDNSNASEKHMELQGINVNITGRH